MGFIPLHELGYYVLTYVTFISLVLHQRALFAYLFILSNTNPLFSFVNFCLVLFLRVSEILLNLQSPTFVGLWKSWAITKFGTSDILLYLLIWKAQKLFGKVLDLYVRNLGRTHVQWEMRREFCVWVGEVEKYNGIDKTQLCCSLCHSPLCVGPRGLRGERGKGRGDF